MSQVVSRFNGSWCPLGADGKEGSPLFSGSPGGDPVYEWVVSLRHGRSASDLQLFLLWIEGAQRQVSFYCHASDANGTTKALDESDEHGA